LTSTPSQSSTCLTKNLPGNTPFQPSKDSGFNHTNLHLLSSLFPSESAPLDASSRPSTSPQGSSAKMSRSELISLINKAIELINEDLNSSWDESTSSSDDQ
jgi:hypothetical protein